MWWATSVLATPCFAASASECSPLDSASTAFAAIRQRAEAIFAGTPLVGIDDCGSLLLHRYLAVYDVDEQLDAWSKRAEVTCWARRKPAVPDDVFSCDVLWFAEKTNGNEMILLRHDIPLPRVLELHTELSQQLPHGSQVVELDFIPVAGGDSWSASRYGYALTLVDHQCFVVTLQCAHDVCHWSMDRASPGLR